MRVEQFEAFARVAERRSFTRAAEDLFLSQAAVYQQVRQLERELGVPLIHVVGKDVRLTVAGNRVYGFANSMTADLAQLKQSLEVFKAGERNLVRVGAASLFGNIAIAIERVRARDPEVAMEFRTAKPAEAVDLVRRGEVDFAFFGLQFVPDDLDSELCGRNQIVPVVTPQHPFASRRRITPKEFFSEPVITYAGSSGKAAVDEWLAAAGIRNASYAATSDSSLAIKAMAMSMGKPALVVRAAIYHELVHGHLVEVPVRGMDIYYDLYVVFRLEWLTRASQEVLEELRSLWTKQSGGAARQITLAG